MQLKNGSYEPPVDLPWEAREIIAHLKRSPKIAKEVQAHSTFEEFCTF